MPFSLADNFVFGSNSVWRDVVAIAAIVVPIVMSIIFYLLKKSSDYQQRLIDEKVNAVKASVENLHKHRETDSSSSDKEIDEIYSILKDLQAELSKLAKDQVSQQNSCREVFVTVKQYENDAQVQKRQIETMNAASATANATLDRAFSLLEQLLRQPPELGR